MPTSVHEPRSVPYWYSLPIVIIFNWFFMSHFKAYGLLSGAAKRGPLGEGTQTDRGIRDESCPQWDWGERRQNKVINNLLKFVHKRPQSHGSHPWLYSKVPIMSSQKTTVRGWHSAIKQIISSWRNRKTLIWGVDDGVRRISVKGSS